MEDEIKALREEVETMRKELEKVRRFLGMDRVIPHYETDRANSYNAPMLYQPQSRDSFNPA